MTIFILEWSTPLMKKNIVIYIDIELLSSPTFTVTSNHNNQDR